MPARLTQAEKEAKGTHRKDRDIEARPLEEIRREIEETQQNLKDIQYNLTEAGKQIRDKGMFIETVVTNSNGEHMTARKVNPAFKIQRDALSAIKSLRRYLTLLKEEETAANAKEQKRDEWADFD